MIQATLAALGFMAWRALAAVGSAIWMLVRPGARFLSGVLVLAATIALAIDVTRWQTGAQGPTFKSLEDHIRSAAPATLDGIAATVSGALHPVLWSPVVTSLLALPAWLTLLTLGLLMGFAARERSEINIFIN